MYLLLSDKDNSKIQKVFFDLLKEKGAFRILSDNYAITFLLICLVLLKYKNFQALEVYVINCTVWLCDRYDENGISNIGSSFEEKSEQLLSERLDGLNFYNRKTSFLASILLSTVAYIGNKKLYEDIANDLKSSEIIMEYYHINNYEELFDYSKIKVQTDFNYSLEFYRGIFNNI